MSSALVDQKLTLPVRETLSDDGLSLDRVMT
jgi:hypothetical protein